MTDAESEIDPPFRVDRPTVFKAPLVLNSPHSGNVYTQSFRDASRLDLNGLRRSEDCFVDELFSPASALGVPLMAARFPRAWLDVNREPWEVDPAMFRTAVPGHVNAGSVRVAGGLGTIPKIVSEGEMIYARQLDWSEAEARIKRYYFPYHNELRALMADAYRRHGTAILLDCHSMPSTAGLSGAGRPDIVLGDRHGTSCAQWIVSQLEDDLKAHGLKVSRNRPYAGGFITQKFGRPREDVHAIQIEINRALYMNEVSMHKTRGFSRLQALLLDVVSRLIASALAAPPAPGIAAE